MHVCGEFLFYVNVRSDLCASLLSFSYLHPPVSVCCQLNVSLLSVCLYGWLLLSVQCPLIARLLVPSLALTVVCTRCVLSATERCVMRAKRTCDDCRGWNGIRKQRSSGVAGRKHKGSILSQCEFKVSVKHSDRITHAVQLLLLFPSRTDDKP
jgi:hypothetical protein